tara:strand:+ start:1065 stop:1985 length:921 start_codon:yes stop_codon:yes gene_type:complete
MKKAFILHANEKYFDIASTCIKSIRQYSDLPVYLYMINSDKKCNVHNVITIQYNIPTSNKGDNYEEDTQHINNFYIKRNNTEIYDILIQKAKITKHALENFADVVAYIDSDSVSTPYVENIFNYYNHESPYPYFCEGIYEYLFYNGKGGANSNGSLSNTLEHPISELFKLNQHKRVHNKYRQTGYYLAGKNTIDFLDEWYWMCSHPTIPKNIGHYVPFHEETVLNPLLWDKDYHLGLPLVYVNGTLETIHEIYNELGFTGQSREIRSWLKLPPHKEEILFFHGEKRVDTMNKMIIKIKQLHDAKII